MPGSFGKKMGAGGVGGTFLIAGEPVPERTPLLPVELIVRDSCGGRRNPSDRKERH